MKKCLESSSGEIEFKHRSSMILTTFVRTVVDFTDRTDGGADSVYCCDVYMLFVCVSVC